MNRTVRTAGLLSVGLGLVVTACTDVTRAPAAPRDVARARHVAADVGRTHAQKVRVDGLAWQKPLKADVEGSAVIGPSGGVLTMPATGLRLVVPAGAVATPTRFRATAVAGRLVAYDFEPAGSTFAVPLRVEQDPALLDLRQAALRPVAAGYFPARTDLDQARATAAVAELIPVTLSTRTISFPVTHFSGYIITWGRSDDGE